jgi:DNA polymerase I-like protein with 3'-5' exonuclease and polymerase domains
LIKPEPGMAVSYIDYSAMEFLIAAVLSDGHCGSDNPMLDAYNSGDPYLSFAKRVGAAPRDATKKSHAEVRDRYKVVLLATQYGMKAETLAARAGCSVFEAQEMLNQHREIFAQYWSWSDDWLQHAMQSGVMRTAMGWTCRTGIVELNERSIRNWPVQSTGADILRIACILAKRHGIKAIAPIHDALLIEAPTERIEADTALTREIMRRDSRIVLNASADGPHELRTDFKIVRHPERYTDPRGAEIWNQVLKLLTKQGGLEEAA